MPNISPRRSADHEALNVFLGDWRAHGASFGNTDLSDVARVDGEPWSSIHTAHWHTGSFFMVQDERATIAGRPFDTLSIIGVDLQSGGYFVRSIENHGYYRHYGLTRDGDTGAIDGVTERATIDFADGNR